MTERPSGFKPPEGGNPCPAKYQESFSNNSPKYGSFEHPFNRTPFGVHSIKKCRTSSLDKSPAAEGKEEEIIFKIESTGDSE